MQKIAIVTNNIKCERHLQYCSRLEKYFIANGWQVCAGPEGADRVIVCACGFHNFMFKKAVNILEDLRKKGFMRGDVILMGCYTGTHARELKELFKYKTIGFQKERVLDGIIKAKTPFCGVGVNNVFNFRRFDEKAPDEKMFYIKISEGCLGACSYCVIKKAKGCLRSVAKDEIMRQFNAALRAGYKKIFLMGEDAFAYGLDIKTDIIKLMESLLSAGPGSEFYFSGIHSRWLQKYSQEIISFCKRGVIKRLHIGLQHVNEGLLERMGRPVDFPRLYNTLKALKKECPRLLLSADIMVGFPGETDEAFFQLAEFFRKDKCFDKISHFAYSDLKGTPASRQKRKIDSLKIAARWKYLKETLGKRSFFDSSGLSDIYSRAFWLSSTREAFFCKDTFVEV